MYNKVSKYIGVSTSNQQTKPPNILTRTTRQCTNDTQLHQSTDPRQMGPRSLRTASHWANVNEAQLVPRALQWCERSAACALEKALRPSAHLHTCEARTEQNTTVVANNCTTKCKAQSMHSWVIKTTKRQKLVKQVTKYIGVSTSKRGQPAKCTNDTHHHQ